MISAQNFQAPMPLIKTLSWGEIVVEQNNEEFRYRDCKIWPEVSKEWNWKETGTQHSPGIQIADLKEFIDKVDIVILSRGTLLVLKVPQETIDYVKKAGKECIVGQTAAMVDKYNELAKQGKKVGGLFHSTC